MKKGLSLLLAFAMVFSMFASVAFAADNNLTTEQKYQWFVDQGVLKGYPDGDPRLGNNLTRAEFATIAVAIAGLEPKTDTETFSDVKSGQWWHGAIEAAAAAGLVNGVGGGKFDPRSNVTLEQVITVAVRILGLEPVEDANVPGASAWAAGYVQAALDAGLITPQSDYKVAATRGQTIDIVYPTYQSLQLNVESATVLDAKTVEVKFTDGSVVKVTLDQPLPANQEQEITVKHESGKEFKVKVTYVVTTATKVESVTADNLKQVVVKFDGEVDKLTAGDKDNYSIDNGIVVQSATVSDDARSVTLTVQTNLINQQEYKLSVSNVRAGNTVISQKDIKFTPIDAALPVAQKAEALGNKTIKVTFSEPIQSASASNFKIDGVSVIGYTNVTGNTVIVKVFSPLSSAEHTINVAGVTDYAGFKSLSTDLTFTVVEDTTPPTISEVVSATFEKVRLKFSEPIDPNTVLVTNVYWLSGSSKQYPSSVTQISDDTFEFDFTNNKIMYTLDLYVTGVADYSGNKIADDTRISVTPTLDQTRPEVISAELNDARNEFTIKFSKTLDSTSATKSDNYSIKDKDGKEVTNIKTPTLQGDGKTVKLTLAVALKEGETYTLSISGVSDNTTLKNVMLPYSKTIEVGDKTGPAADDIVVTIVSSASVNRLVVSYPEVMAVSGDGSVVDPAKYMYSTDNGTTYKPLPSSAALNITPDGKSAIINIPVSDLDVDTVTHVRISLVKDAAGNYLQGYTTDKLVGAASAPTIQNTTAAIETNKISVEFDQPILSNTISPSDFIVQNAANERLTVIAAQADGAQKVILTLADATKLDETGKYNGQNVGVSLVANPSTSSPAGIQATGSVAQLVDKIKPTLKQVTGSPTGTSLTVEFNENLNDTLTLGSVATDFLIKDKDGNTLVPGTHYNIGDTTPGDNKLEINFVGGAQKGIMTVKLQEPRFILDAATTPNVAKSSNEVLVDADTGFAVEVTSTGAADLELDFNEGLYDSAGNPLDADVSSLFTLTTVVGSSATITSATYDGTDTISFVINGTPANGDKITVNAGAIRDHEGNVYVATFVFNGTEWVLQS